MTIRPAPGLLFRRFSVALPFVGFAVLLMLVNDPNGHLRCQYEWLQFLSMEMLLLLPLITTVLLCISIGRDNLKRTRSVPKLVAVWVLLIVAIPCSGFAAIFTYCNLRMLSPDGMNQHVTTIRLGSRDVEVYRYRDLVCGGGPILYRYQEERSVLPGLKQVKELTREEAEGGYSKLSAKYFSHLPAPNDSTLRMAKRQTKGKEDSNTRRTSTKIPLIRTRCPNDSKVLERTAFRS